MKPKATPAGCLGVLLILAAQAGAVWNLFSPFNVYARAGILLAFAVGCAGLASAYKQGKAA